MTTYMRTPRQRNRLPFLATCVLALCISVTAGETTPSRIGDGGHFLHHRPRVYMNNPDGLPFSVTMHRHLWPVAWGNKGDYTLWVLDPAGKEVARGAIPSGESAATLRVPAGAAGVYVFAYEPAGYSLHWVESSLPRMGVGLGPWSEETTEGGESAGESRWPYGTFILHVMAPRRWYFYVPRDVERFRVKHTVFRFQSHREDYGLVVLNPRGQRVEALYGGRPVRGEAGRESREYAVVRTIETDEGTTGRFWSIWATGGDSHNFSDLQILLDGVPAYLAPAPEQWFNPETGQAPARLVYDESQVRMLDERGRKDETGARLSRDHYLWAPAPFLGDEDYNGMRGPHTIYLDNPEGRAIDVGVGGYILPRDRRLPVLYEVVPPAGEAYTVEDTFGHRDSSRLRLPKGGAGVLRVNVDAVEWYFWSEPAVPMVLAGHPDEGWARFDLQIGVARHWFFRVPAGTESFRVGIEATDPDHVLDAEVHAPDRIVEKLYVRGGEPQTRAVRVPPGMEGKVWFLRLGVGSATRFLSTTPGRPERVRIDASVRLQGVPGYLAPTWGQCFTPNAPGAGPLRP